MAIGVVDEFEFVQIKPQQSKDFIVSLRICQQLLKKVVEQDAVRQVSQKVVLRLVFESYFCRFALDNIRQNTDMVAYLVLGVFDDANIDPCGIKLTVLPTVP